MLPAQTLASPKNFNDDSIQGMFFTQALYAAPRHPIARASIKLSFAANPIGITIPSAALPARV
jgi:hypothetical protein